MALTTVAVVLAVTQPLPQVVRLLRTRSVAGVSGPTAWLGLVVNLAWMAYGTAQGLLPVALLSGAYVAGYATIAGLLVARGTRRGLGIAVVGAVALVGLTSAAGWVALGTALALSVGVQFVPQVLEAWRGDDLSGLAPGTYLLCAADGGIWGAYGLAVGDVPLVLYGVVMLGVAVLVLIPRQRWARRAVATAPATTAPAAAAGIA